MESIANETSTIHSGATVGHCIVCAPAPERKSTFHPVIYTPPRPSDHTASTSWGGAKTFKTNYIEVVSERVLPMSVGWLPGADMTR